MQVPLVRLPQKPQYLIFSLESSAIRTTQYTRTRVRGIFARHIGRVNGATCVSDLAERLGVMGAGYECRHDVQRLSQNTVVLVVFWGVLTEVLKGRGRAGERERGGQK